MGYYDYTQEFNSLIQNTEEIIDNQTTTQNTLNNMLTTTQVLVYITVLMFTIGIARKIFRNG